MGFGEELWKLTPPFLKRAARKEDSDTWVWLSTLSAVFDRAREKVFLVRRQALVPTASGPALDWHGRDWKMPRFPGETDEAYRERLKNAPEFYLRSGTKRGLRAVLEALGYPDAEIYPLYKEKYKFRFLDESWGLGDGLTLEPVVPDARLDYLGKWSQLAIKLNIGDQPFTSDQHDILMKHLDMVRPPEGRIYAVMFSVVAETRIFYHVSGKLAATLEAMTSTEEAVLNRKRVLDGSWQLGSRQRSLIHATIETETRPLQEKPVYHTLAEGMWYLDGGGPRYQLDGRWALSAPITLGDTIIRLDGQHTLVEGLKLDASWVLDQYAEPRHKCSITEWKDGQLTERRWLQ